jgi:4-hydroxythreonine-4-phosphate dehydrogenase
MLELCTPVILLMLSYCLCEKNLNLTLPLHGIDKLDQILPGKKCSKSMERRS